MYIAKLRLQGFRCFEDTEIEFNSGLNVIIGENNAGKTNVLKALTLIFGGGGQGIKAEDFWRSGSLPEEAPEITITATIRSSETDSNTDRGLVASWLTKLDDPWEATLAFRCFLPERDKKRFEERLGEIDPASLDEQEAKHHFWDLVEDYLPFYSSRVYGGDPKNANSAEPEWLRKFDCQFVDAIRDVEAKFFRGSSPMMRAVLKHFIDVGANADKKDSLSQDFARMAKSIVEQVRGRVDLDKALHLAKRTGATIGGAPVLGGRLTETDVVSALRLMVQDGGVTLPTTYNGLGYNNLVYISLLLAGMEADRDFVEADDAKVFPILLIEEPEAHLHPAMQYKLLRFLNEELKKRTYSRQIFVTTHSTHITAAVGLDPIVVLSKSGNGRYVSYPGRVFSESREDQNSKNYVERYLDATKSNMLFSSGIIFVEGISELMMIPCLGELDGINLEDHHVTVISVDGLMFKHFLKLFGTGIDKERRYAAMTSRRVACLIDADPARKVEDKNRWQACWPFELGAKDNTESYRKLSPLIKELTDNSLEQCVRIMHGTAGQAKTFEYDLAFHNPGFVGLVTESCAHAGALKEMMQAYSNGSSGEGPYDDKFEDSLEGCSWGEDEKARAKIAANYLRACGGTKGEHAFLLQQQLLALRQNGGTQEFDVPDHIAEAIRWACGVSKDD